MDISNDVRADDLKEGEEEVEDLCSILVRNEILEVLAFFFFLRFYLFIFRERGRERERVG